MINNRSDSCVYEILFVCKEIKFKMAVEQYWFESDNLTISVYSYRHWKNRFKIKYGYLFGNSWQGMSSHVEPSLFDCKRIENAQLTHD